VLDDDDDDDEQEQQQEEEEQQEQQQQEEQEQAGIKGGRTGSRERSAADCGARPAGCKICLQNPVIKVAAAAPAAAAAAAGAREPGLMKFRQKAKFKFLKISK
jgi:cell division protein FtsN